MPRHRCGRPTPAWAAQAEQTARYFPLHALWCGVWQALFLIARRALRRAVGRTGRTWVRIDVRDECLRIISDWGADWQRGAACRCRDQKAI